MSNQQAGKGRGRGRPSQQQQQQRPPQQQQSQSRSLPHTQTQGAPAPKIVIPTATPSWVRPQQASSTTVYAESNVASSGTTSTSIQATQSSSVETPIGQQKITQSTLTSINEDTASSHMQSLSLTHTEQTTSSTVSTVKTLGAEFPAKPRERGNLGRPIALFANHFAINLKKPFTIYQYDVDVTKLYGKEGEKSVKIRVVMKEVFKELMKKLPSEFNNRIVYNFSKNLFSLKELPFQNSVTYEFKIENQAHHVTIKKINELIIDPRKYADDQQAINILDLIFTQNLNYSHINVNRSFFKEGGDIFELGFGLELWRGAYSSVRPSELGLTWNVDSANSAFLISTDLLEAATYFYNCKVDQLKQSIEKDRDGKEIGVSFLNEFKGREVKTRTGGFRKKIQSLGPDSFYQFEWNKPNGQKVKVSIKDYMQQQYGINLRYPYLPCVNLGKTSYMPMELCATELKHQKKLDPKQTADVIKQTAVKASDRRNYIQNWVNKSNIDKDPVLKEFNIDVSLRLVQVDGRVLEPPDVIYQQTQGVSSRKIGENGSWDHRNLYFNTPVKINKWLLLNFASRVRQDASNSFIDELIRIGKIHGISVAEPLDVIDSVRKSKEQEVFRLFDDIVTKYKELDLVLIILPGTSRVYNVIKTCGDLKYGIATQAVEDRNVNRINDQTISNILLKINTKLGGKNFTFSAQSEIFKKHLQGFFDIPLMIFGADVTHPAPGDNITESIAAVTGSLDRQCCLYGARLYSQRSPRGQAYEMIHDLDKMALSLLQSFYQKNKTYPRRIIFYRDGVSEGQFQYVIRHEMNKMREACQTINTSYKPAITFVIVQKRHHTRLFPVHERDMKGKSQNIPPGTVVDKDITTKNMFDFFLCSHSGIQGTSRPCRYFVLHDENNFNMNQMQLLSHYLCHTYSRCPRSVSYPAPAYYAHLAAFRGRDYIRPSDNRPINTIVSKEIEVHEKIRDRMFFN